MKSTMYLRRVAGVALCAALLAACDVAGAPAQPTAAPQPSAAPLPTAVPSASPGAETAYPAPAVDTAYPAPLEPSAYPVPTGSP